MLRYITPPIILIIVLFHLTAYAGKKQQCKTQCKAERTTYITQCVEEEKEYWNNISENEVVRNCRFLTYFSYVECVDECVNPNKRAVEFYDKHVKNFPE